MPEDSSRDYYARREAQHRKAAVEAKDQDIVAIHVHLAETYGRIATGVYDRQSTVIQFPKIGSV